MRFNDWAHREENTSQSLGIPLTHEKFSLAQKLAGRLWGIYGRAYRVLLGADTIEPNYSKLEDRPAMLLKHLSHSLYLERKLDLASDELNHHIPAMHAFEQEMLGEDDIRDVFIKYPV